MIWKSSTSNGHIPIRDPRWRYYLRTTLSFPVIESLSHAHKVFFPLPEVITTPLHCITHFIWKNTSKLFSALPLIVRLSGATNLAVYFIPALHSTFLKRDLFILYPLFCSFAFIIILTTKLKQIFSISKASPFFHWEFYVFKEENIF